MAGKLAGKSAIIMGGTSGMGRETAQYFAREGARLAICGRRAGLLQEVGEQIAAETGQSVLGLACDAGDPEQTAAAIRAAQAHLGKIDTFVYAAGLNIKQRVMGEIQADAWEDMLRINLTGAFHCTQQLLPVFREQGGGLIIYLSSIAALRGDAVSGVAYQAAKRGLDGISLGTMAEQKEHGIRTSVVYPGFCDTPFVLQRPAPTPPEVLAKALQPEDVAEACLFIAALPERCHVPELVIQPSRL
ncbi:MAG: SDR family oxidoreductase [Armatimonadota bacterium]